MLMNRAHHAWEVASSLVRRTAIVALVAACGSSGFASVASAQSSDLKWVAGEVTVGGDAEDVAIGDTNGDGKRDAVVSNLYARRLMFLAGDGAGHFTQTGTLDTGGQPTRVGLVDFNHDGSLDLAVVALSTATQGALQIYLGNNAGSFALHGSVEVGNPTALLVSDIDGDGFGDVALPTYEGNKLLVLYGTSQATVGTPIEIDAGPNPFSVVAEDFDGNGYRDLAVTNYVIGAGAVSLLKATGPRTFASRVDYPAGGSSTGLVAADLDADGQIDLAVANSVSGEVATLYGVGDGTFSAPTLTSLGGKGTFSLAVTDVDADGALEILAANSASGTVVALPRMTNRTFASGQPILDMPNVWRLISADLNADGHGDVMVIANGSAISASVVMAPQVVPSRRIAIAGTLAFGTRDAGSLTSQPLTITNSGNCAVTINGFALPPAFTIDWSGGTIAAGESRVVSITFAPKAAGVFGGDVVVNANQTSGATTVIASGSAVVPPPPTMTLSTTVLQFGGVSRGGKLATKTPPQNINVSQTGFGTVTWTASSNLPFVQVSPSTGTGSGNVSVRVDPGGALLVAGAITGTVTFTYAGASTPSSAVNVVINVIPYELSGAPTGFVDTPTENRTGVTGAVPFTGWAVDDVAVESVAICRDAVAPEIAPVDGNCAGLAKIFIGFAVFVDGARPDVQRAFPSVPLSSRAGWGFMVLTNMLPNGGNGTYVLSIYARDNEGKTSLLGTRTMTCANAGATLPFGQIDTPLQGGTASGNAFINFGWALTPTPKFIPIDGSTIDVLINGRSIGAVDYDHFRPDVATAFPGYRNSNGAVGFKTIDTTQLANGMHTISWTVRDSTGATEGLGSRFFEVRNATAAVQAIGESVSASRLADAPNLRTLADAVQVPLDGQPVLARRGWDRDVPWEHFPSDAGAFPVIRGEEVDKIELLLGEYPGERYKGYVRVGEALLGLPIGSTLDAATGRFTWAPGAGFVGTYDLVFIRWAGDVATIRKDVRIILEPKAERK